MFSKAIPDYLIWSWLSQLRDLMITLIKEEQISGVIERVTFHSTETGYTVLKVAPFNKINSVVPVIVHQVQVYAGASMKFFGNWTTHPKFGEQFKATKVLEIKPASAAALEKYLGSGLIKGVGPKTAKKIVKHFGSRTLEVFEKSIDELLKVPSIAEKKLTHIQASWEEHRAIRDVMIFLQTHGVSTLFAVKIFKRYGPSSIQVVSDNPYQLAQDIYGVGFFSADRIALALGFKIDGEKRILAGIRHVLASSREEGHCYLTRNQIIENTKELLELQVDDLISNGIDNLLHTNDIRFRTLIIDSIAEHCYYSKTLYYEEEKTALKIKMLLATQKNEDMNRIQGWMKRYCQNQDIQLSDEQARSVAGIVQKSFSILTGGPGCGKTTTLKVLVKLLIAMRRKVLLGAPTGRAAQRMSEVIGMEAKTIHRLLEWDPSKGGFKKNAESPLQCDFLVIDECSMLDISLAYALLSAVPDDAQILFIGDPDQLPSVGAGAVLADLLACQNVYHFKLTQIFRQAAQSSIIKYAHKINRGDVPSIMSPIHEPEVWNSANDCMFIDSDEATLEQLKFIKKAKYAIDKTLNDGESYLLKTEDQITGTMNKVAEQISVDQLYNPEPDSENIRREPILTIPQKFRHVNLESLSLSSSHIDELKETMKKIHPWSSLNYGMTALDTIKRLYMTRIYNKLGKNTEIQILTPQVRGSLGAHNLNSFIQENVNPKTANQIEIKIGDRFFRCGDRIIQTRNNYDLNVFNGDIGYIESINSEDFSCVIRFTDQNKIVTYKKDDLSELSLAYAITIHKSQGSEFDAVIIPVSTQHFKMLYRNLIYTGLTRAKKLAILVGSRRALAMAVQNIDNKKRQTALQFLVSN